MTASSGSDTLEGSLVTEWVVASFAKKEWLEWSNSHLWKINQEYGGLPKKSFSVQTSKPSELVWIHYPLARVPQLWIWFGAGKFPWDKLPVPKRRVAIYLDSSVEAKEVPVDRFESVVVHEWSPSFGVGVRWVEPQL